MYNEIVADFSILVEKVPFLINPKDTLLSLMKTITKSTNFENL